MVSLSVALFGITPCMILSCDQWSVLESRAHTVRGPIHILSHMSCPRTHQVRQAESNCPHAVLQSTCSPPAAGRSLWMRRHERQYEDICIVHPVPAGVSVVFGFRTERGADSQSPGPRAPWTGCTRTDLGDV